MGKNSSIEWTHHTFQSWIGCTKVSPGCLNCYAEVFDSRKLFDGRTHWGMGVPRKVMSNKYWSQPAQWDRAAKEAGVKHRVFCASMADVFDEEAPEGQRERLWGVIKSTPNLIWLILTKRPQNMTAMLPTDWGTGYPNVWLGTSVEDQKRADERIPILLSVPAVCRFLSVEPLLAEVDLRNYVRTEAMPKRIVKPYSQPIEYIPVIGIDWLLVGGESGHGARPFNVDWARKIRDERGEAKFFFKQYGHIESNPDKGDPTAKENDGETKGGRMLDGRTWDEVPVVG